MTNLAWAPSLKIEKKYIKKPASGTVAVSGGVKLRAGTPLNSPGAVANTSNAAMLVAEDHIFYTDPAGRDTSVDVITGGYVDINKAEAVWGNTYSSDAKAALADAGIVLVDEMLQVTTELPVASSETLGCVYIGEGISASDDGMISVEPPLASDPGYSTATTVEGLLSDYNNLLANLRAVGVIAAE